MLPNLLNGSSQANRVASLFDRLFDGDFLTQATQNWSGSSLAMWENDQTIFVEMDAPGVTDTDVEVTFHNGELLIIGERKGERREGSHDTRRYGRFGQRIKVSIPVDVEKIDAKMTNGVLTVTLPKSEAAKPHRIALRSE
ncbi:Hsp20/alpha crystallin family protein [Zavarzinella formosa]|uniref:Hsp20/alpha crystallin family protein n=1 Tax=Zavarzinella formosa TaxID=360055 RepID=UPI000317DC42|nr:Hsp20/alpha crystallin family protein [Zavarzinella formosa]